MVALQQIREEEEKATREGGRVGKRRRLPSRKSRPPPGMLIPSLPPSLSPSHPLTHPSFLLPSSPSFPSFLPLFLPQAL